MNYGLFMRFVTCIAFFSGISSQTIIGTVVDAATKTPIQNVNVYIKNQNVGTATSSSGSFSLDYSNDKNIILTVSHVGYKDKSVVIEDKSKPLVITLDEMFFQMDDIVVTSTRTDKLHKNVPVATEIISRKDILDSGALNVEDLLNGYSGVSLQTSVDGGSMLNILGMDSRYILILVDGQPITGKFNNHVSLDQIPASQVKKIEIIKGPNSSLYGSEAMAGVINIITLDTSDENFTSISIRYNGSENKLKSDGLNHGSESIQFSSGRIVGPVTASVSCDIELIETDKTIQQIDADDISKYSGTLDLKWKASTDHTFGLKDIIYSHTEYGASSLMTTSTRINRNSASVNHRWQFSENWNLSHTLNHSYYSRSYVQERPWGDLVTDDLTKEDSFEYESLIQKETASGVINAGFEGSSASYTSDRVQNGTQRVSTASIFGQYDFFIGNALNMVAGVRLDHYSEYEAVTSPRIGLMYTIAERWKIRTTWGKGFRSPSFMERFIDWNHVQFGYRVLGNSELKPELSNGFTAGVEYYHPASYQVSLMVYGTDFKNLIEDYSIEAGLLSYRNIEQATYRGLELQGRWIISNSWLSSWGFNIVDNRDGAGKLIPNTQPLSGYARLAYKSPKRFWNGSIRMKWVGPYTPEDYNPDTGEYEKAGNALNAYTILDMNASFQVWKRINLGFGIRNAGDYIHERYGPFIGRSMFIEISTTI